MVLGVRALRRTSHKANDPLTLLQILTGTTFCHHLGGSWAPRGPLDCWHLTAPCGSRLQTDTSPTPKERQAASAGVGAPSACPRCHAALDVGAQTWPLVASSLPAGTPQAEGEAVSSCPGPPYALKPPGPHVFRLYPTPLKSGQRTAGRGCSERLAAEPGGRCARSSVFPGGARALVCALLSLRDFQKVRWVLGGSDKQPRGSGIRTSARWGTHSRWPRRAQGEDQGADPGGGGTEPLEGGAGAPAGPCSAGLRLHLEDRVGF